jgi:hypothetical protein
VANSHTAAPKQSSSTARVVGVCPGTSPKIAMTSASNSNISASAARQPDLAQDLLQIDRQRHEQQPGDDRGGPGHGHEQLLPGL